jgi:hypothetical protein
MDKEECIKQIKELIKSAREDCDDSREDMNSYAHGYDIGRLGALSEVLELLESD